MMASSVETVSVPTVFQKAQWQAVLFAPRPRRTELLTLKPSWPCRPIALAVHRNTPFEFIAQAMPAFFAYAGLHANIHFGDYDDTLQYKGDLIADLHVIWLDFERYRTRLEGTALVDWLSARLRSLRAITAVPILVANWPADHKEAEIFNDCLAVQADLIPGVRIYDRRPLLAELGNAFWDQRLASLGGTTLSNLASVLTARDIALRWVPAAIRPRLKCLAVDLDNTLYDGVLGEDGVDGLKLSSERLALQRRLLALHAQGFFLAAVSKNEARDVEHMLTVRSDFVVQRHHFSALAISWESKATGLARIAETLRIGLDAIVLMDDNLGEIAEVGAVLPMVSCIHSADPTVALAALTYGPDLLAWSQDETDRLRAADLAATAQREKLLSDAALSIAYLGSLETRLDFFSNPHLQRNRLCELSNKTNQFNLALKRFKEATVADWLERPASWVVAVRLSDRLSDSGIVGALFLHAEDGTLFVEELCISCRALGRKLEDLMIVTPIDRVASLLGCRTVAFAHATGLRNAPARDWLAAFTDAPLEERHGYCSLPWPRPGLEERLRRIPVTLCWH